MGEKHVFIGTDLPDACPYCIHPFDPHIFLAQEFVLLVAADLSFIEVPDNGLILCPEPTCNCTATWSLGIRGRYSRFSELPAEIVSALPRFSWN